MSIYALSERQAHSTPRVLGAASHIYVYIYMHTRKAQGCASLTCLLHVRCLPFESHEKTGGRRYPEVDGFVTVRRQKDETARHGVPTTRYDTRCRRERARERRGERDDSSAILVADERVRHNKNLVGTNQPEPNVLVVRSPKHACLTLQRSNC